MKGNMTILMVVLVGVGALLIVSAIENQPIAATFQGILKGNPIKASSPGPEGTKTSVCPFGDIYVLPAGQSSCPKGYKTGALPNTCYCCYGGC